METERTGGDAGDYVAAPWSAHHHSSYYRLASHHQSVHPLLWGSVAVDDRTHLHFVEVEQQVVLHHHHPQNC